MLVIHSFRATMLAVALFLTIPSVAHAQYAADQPKTLKGVKTVQVNFVEPSGKMDNALREEMFDAAVLELRKAGIRVTREPTPTMSGDALVNMTVRIVTGLTDYIEVRMDVEQKVTLDRTSEKLQLVTWYYEEAGNPGSWRSSAKPMVMKATNKFISDWLDANNR